MSAIDVYYTTAKNDYDAAVKATDYEKDNGRSERQYVLEKIQELYKTDIDKEQSVNDETLKAAIKLAMAMSVLKKNHEHKSVSKPEAKRRGPTYKNVGGDELLAAFPPKSLGGQQSGGQQSGGQQSGGQQSGGQQSGGQQSGGP